MPTAMVGGSNFKRKHPRWQNPKISAPRGERFSQQTARPRQHGIRYPTITVPVGLRGSDPKSPPPGEGELQFFRRQKYKFELSAAGHVRLVARHRNRPTASIPRPNHAMQSHRQRVAPGEPHVQRSVAAADRRLGGGNCSRLVILPHDCAAKTAQQYAVDQNSPPGSAGSNVKFCRPGNELLPPSGAPSPRAACQFCCRKGVFSPQNADRALDGVGQTFWRGCPA